MEAEERELLYEEEVQSQLLGIRKSSRLRAKEKQADGSDESDGEDLNDSDIYEPNEEEDEESDYMPGRKSQKKKKQKLGLRRDKAMPLISGLNREDTGGNILANK